MNIHLSRNGKSHDTREAKNPWEIPKPHPTPPHPPNQIQCVTKSKILGHLENADNNLTIATHDRLRKQKLHGNYYEKHSPQI